MSSADTLPKERRAKKKKPDPPLVMPNEREAELALLGALVLDNAGIERAAQDEDLFYYEDTQKLWSAIHSSYQKHKSCDLVGLKAELGASVEELGGVDRLAKLVDEVPNAKAWPEYLSIVLRKARQREYLRIAYDIQDGILKKDLSPDEIYALADQIKAKTTTEPTKTFPSVVDDAVVLLESIRKGGQDLLWGWDSLDRKVGGLRRKTLSVVGGKTSQGKSTLVLDVALTNAKKGKRVLISSLENPDQVPIRLAAKDSDIRLDWLSKPDMVGEEAYEKAKAALANLRRFEDRILAVGASSVQNLDQVSRAFKPDVVILDYIQRYAHRFCSGDTGTKAHEVGKAASDFADLAIRHNAAGILVSQFKRRSEEERGREPILDDLKESGDLENYADTILLLYWKWRDTNNPKVDAEQYKVVIAKNKLGPIDEAYLRIDPKTLKLAEWVDRSGPDGYSRGGGDAEAEDE